MKIYIKTIHGLAYALLFVPFFLFVAGWLKPVFAIPVIALILFLSFRLYKRESADLRFIQISRKSFVIIIICALVMAWFSGGGGFFPQSYDMFMRNAIYRDLILEKWPVFYEETNRALVYYFGFWLIPSSICKLFVPVVSEYGIWLIARGVIFIFMFLYLLIIFFLLTVTASYFTNDEVLKDKQIFILCFIFFIWGNLAIVGAPFSEILNSSYCSSLKELLRNPLMLEHWAGHFATENSNMTQIMNVCNQALPAWLGTLLFLSDKKNIRIYGCIALPLALLAPFPMLGLITMMLVSFILLLYEHKIKFTEVFSAENFLSLLFVIIAIPFYAGLNPTKSISLTQIFAVTNNPLQGIATIILFTFLTFGIFGLFCIERKTLYFLAIIFFNFIFCFICVGGANDFQLRATIPFSIYFMVCVIHLFFKEKDYIFQKKAMRIILLIIAVIPVMNIWTLWKIAIDTGTLSIENDTLYTLSNITGDQIIVEQYTKFNPSKDIFFHYLAKGDYSINHPVIEYQQDEQGDVYVSRVCLTSDMVDLVNDNIQGKNTPPRSITDTLQNMNYNEIEVISFAPREVIPVIANKVTEINKDDINIVWKNYHENISKYPEYFFLAVVDLSYSGMDELRFCDESRTSEWETGISVSLTDDKGNTMYYPFSYAYTRHVIYPGSTEKFLLNIPKPGSSGEYYLKFFFFIQMLYSRVQS